MARLTSEALGELCCRHGLAAIYAFGSRGRAVFAMLAGQGGGGETGSADVDIGVRPRSGICLGLDEKVQLTLELEDLIGCARVDLVVLPEADPFVAAEIIRGERLFVENEYESDEYDLYVLRRAGDLAPLERERLELILKGHRDTR